MMNYSALSNDELLEYYSLAKESGQIEKAISALEAIENNKDSSFSIGEMISNIPSSAGKLATDTYAGLKQVVTNPVESAEGLYHLANSVGHKIDSKIVPYLPDWLVENTNKSQNWLADKGLPVNRNAVSKQDMVFPNQGPANLLGDAISNRYGSVDKTLSTLQNDPVGMMADASGVMLGGGLLGVKNAGKIGAAIDPLNAVKNGLLSTGRLIPESLPQNMYKSAVKFSTTLPEKKRTQLTKIALDEGIMPTGKGLDKIQATVETINNEINALIDASVNSGKKIPVNAVFKELTGLRKKMGGAKAEATADLKRIDDAARDFSQHMKSINKTHMTVRELQEFKTNLYEKIYGDKISLRSIPEKDQARSALARGARKTIENEIPEIAGLNMREGGLLDLQNALDRPASRIDNHNYVSLDMPAKTGGGYVAGKAAGSPEVGVALGVGMGILGAPKLKSVNAIMLEKLRKAGNQPGLLFSDPEIRSMFQQGAYQNRERQ